MTKEAKINELHCSSHNINYPILYEKLLVILKKWPVVVSIENRVSLSSLLAPADYLRNRCFNLET